MKSELNRREWEAAAAVYAAGKTEGASPDDLCCPLLPVDLRGLRILDAGCGPGEICRFLARQGAEVVGVDISAALVARAQAAETAYPLGIRYAVHDLVDELPFEDETFDIAIAVMALMDVEDPLAALRHIGRTVRPGGLFVFSLLHPCFYRPRFNAQGTGIDLEHYFDRTRVEGRYIEAGDGTRVSYRQFHRTLSDYLNTLIECGFCLTRLVEPGNTQLAISARKLGKPLKPSLSGQR